MSHTAMNADDGKERVLCIDDDPNLLASYQRQMRKRFHLETAAGAQAGLNVLTGRGPYAVVISDLRMPGMDGIELLTRVREICPDSTRIMLTGYADLETAIQAVNEGNIFRFLTKPCHPDVLAKAIEAGLQQYRLIQEERELLEETLSGTIKVLTEALSLLNPEAFGRTARIGHYMKEIAFWMGVGEIWQLETAAGLSQIGCIAVSEDVLKKIFSGQSLTPQERQQFLGHPAVAAELLAHIPRFEEVAKIVAYQEKRFDGSGPPPGAGVRKKDIPIGARILKVLLDFDILRTAGVSKTKTLQTLRARQGWYDPDVLAALEAVVKIDARYYKAKAVHFADLQEGMVIARDIRGSDRTVLFPRGMKVGRTLMERLRYHAHHGELTEPLHVLKPFGHG
jgi:response regulator RpfG family c-di-GMP phosphodiesterase